MEDIFDSFDIDFLISLLNSTIEKLSIVEKLIRSLRTEQREQGKSEEFSNKIGPHLLLTDMQCNKE